MIAANILKSLSPIKFDTTRKTKPMIDITRRTTKDVILNLLFEKIFKIRRTNNIVKYITAIIFPVLNKLKLLTRIFWL